jgi:hypothetical protein
MTIDEAVPPAAVAIEDEILAQQAYRLDGIGIKLAGAPDRLPVAAQ